MKNTYRLTKYLLIKIRTKMNIEFNKNVKNNLKDNHLDGALFFITFTI